MLKVYSSQIKKWSQTWQDEIEDVDWGDDDPSHLVSDENLGDYLVDEVEKPQQTPEMPVSPTIPTIPTIPEGRDEIPTIDENLTPDAVKEIIYDDVNRLLDDAMKSNQPDEFPETIGFDYTNRHGAYAGWRTVEPHYIFHAYTTGNMILVTWDRDINDIRAFIIGNIHPNGVRYVGEIFSPKPEIMRGIISN